MRLLLVFVLVFNGLLCFAQRVVVCVTEIGTGKEIPFAAISGERADTITDAIGQCSLPIGKYIISHPNNRPKEVIISSIADTVKVGLFISSLYQPVKDTPDSLYELMGEILAQKNSHDPLTRGKFEYLSYTRYTLSPDNVNQVAQFFNKGLKFTGLPLLAITNYDHHLLMAEMTTRYNYKSFLDQRETITSAQVTGIDRDDVVAPIFLQNSTSPYEERISINGSFFLNPVSPTGIMSYQYQLADTLYRKQGNWVAIKFYPNKRGYKRLIKGMMWVDINSLAIMAYYAELADRYDSKISISFLNNQVDGELALKQKLVKDYLKLSSNPTNIYSLTTYKPVKFIARQYDATIFKYDSSRLNTGGINPDVYERFPYTKKDSLTLRYYKEQGEVLKVNRYVNVIERLYNAELPIGSYLNLQLSKLFAFSAFEGLRVGIGLETSDDLSERIKANGYLGYGIFDSKLKYGIRGSYALFPEDKLKITAERSFEVKEPATQNFMFDKQMYGAESLRRLQLPQVDYYLKHQLGLESQLFRNFYAAAGIRLWNFQPNYQYQFITDEGNVIQNDIRVGERYVGIRWSYGEQFAKIDKLKLSLGTVYPELWLQYTSSLNLKNLSAPYSFNKIDVKVNFKYFHPEGSITGVQIIGGIANGEIPYQNLYNIKGSYRTLSLVTFNSFETMRFQEFLADRFLALFVSHQLPAWHFTGLPFQPRLTVIQNIGVGQLSSANRHKEIAFKTFNKPYIETGLFISDALTLEIGGGTLGLGAGLFARYGPNALPKIKDNIAFKLTVNFSF